MLLWVDIFVEQFSWQYLRQLPNDGVSCGHPTSISWLAEINLNRFSGSLKFQAFYLVCTSWIRAVDDWRCLAVCYLVGSLVWQQDWVLQVSYLNSIAYFWSGLNEGICTDPGVYRTVLFLVGKLFISCCFAGIYSFTSELFPTTVRSAAMGLCSTCGRIGGIMAPIIADMVGGSVLTERMMYSHTCISVLF